MLVLHGLFGSGMNWSSTARRLASTFHVYCLDLRNHGDSPHAPGMSYREMAADVSGFMDAHGLASARILGHSMGGKTAMMLALLEPERVERLCVVDIAPVDYAHDYDVILQALGRIDLQSIRRRADADAVLAASIAQPALRDFLLQNLRRRDDAWVWRIDLDTIASQIDVITGWPCLSDVVVFHGPALFIGGACSDHLKPQFDALIHERFPQASIRRIADAGHWVHTESPEAFARLVDEFLGREG